MIKTTIAITYNGKTVAIDDTVTGSQIGATIDALALCMKRTNGELINKEIHLGEQIMFQVLSYPAKDCCGQKPDPTVVPPIPRTVQEGYDPKSLESNPSDPAKHID